MKITDNISSLIDAMKERWKSPKAKAFAAISTAMVIVGAFFGWRSLFVLQVIPIICAISAILGVVFDRKHWRTWIWYGYFVAFIVNDLQALVRLLHLGGV